MDQDKSRQMTPCRLVLGPKARLEENLLGKGARLQVRATIYTSNVILRLHTLTPKSMPVPNTARPSVASVLNAIRSLLFEERGGRRLDSIA